MAELKDWLNSINFTKDNLVEEDLNVIKDYPPYIICLLYTSPSPRDLRASRMPSSA